MALIRTNRVVTVGNVMVAAFPLFGSKGYGPEMTAVEHERRLD
jgi:hypothetical protein